MVKNHSSIGFRYPVFDVFWGSNSNAKNLLAIAGGGGSAKSGVGNNLNICEVSMTKNTLNLKTPIDVNTGDELCGVVSLNSKGTMLAAGFGSQINIYSVVVDRLILIGKLRLESEVEGGASVNSLTFGLQDQALVAGCEDGCVKQWRLKNVFAAEKIAKTLVSESSENPQQALDHLSFDAAPTFKGHTAAITAVVFHPDVNVLASTAKDGTCRIFEGRHATELAQLACETDPQALALELKLASTPRSRTPRPPPKLPQFRSCRFSSNGDQLFTIQSTSRGPVTLKCTNLQIEFLSKRFSVTVGKCQKVIPANVPATCMSVSYDGERVAIGTVEGKVIILNSSNLAKIQQFQAHDLPVTALCFAPDSTNMPYDLISSSADSKCTLMKSQGSSSSFLKAFIAILVLVFSVGWNYTKFIGVRYFDEFLQKQVSTEETHILDRNLDSLTKISEAESKFRDEKGLKPDSSAINQNAESSSVPLLNGDRQGPTKSTLLQKGMEKGLDEHDSNAINQNADTRSVQWTNGDLQGPNKSTLLQKGMEKDLDEHDFVNTPSIGSQETKQEILENENLGRNSEEL